MTRRPLLRETLARRPTTAEAVAAGFILPAERRVDGSPVYATAGLVEELLAACAEDWQAVAERMARGAWAAAAARAAIRNEAVAPSQRWSRWHAKYGADDGRRLPIAVVMQPQRPRSHAVILAMLDGE